MNPIRDLLCCNFIQRLAIPLPIKAAFIDKSIRLMKSSEYSSYEAATQS